MQIRAFHFLPQQVDFLERTVAPDLWAQDDELAARDLEDCVALALETLDRIRKHSDMAVKQDSAAESAKFLGYWRRWHQVALRVVEAVDRVEAHGHHLEQSDAFRQAINEAGMAEHWDAIMAARARLAR